MRGPQAEAPCALQALTSALTLSPCREHNCAGSSEPIPTNPPSSKSPRPATRSSSFIHSYSPSRGGDPDEEVVESSSIRRRGQDGQAVGLSEDGAPSPTRIQRRSPARGHAAVPPAKELRLVQPLCDPRIAALRAGVENNAENEAPDSSRLHSRTIARTSPAASQRTGPRTRLSSPLPCKAYSVASRSVACGSGGGSCSGSRGVGMEVD